MRRHSWLVLAAILVAVVAAVAAGYFPRPVPVETARVSRGPLKVTLDEEGKTRAVERYVVSAPVAGFMRRIDLDVGDAVRRGQAVAALEPLRSGDPDPRSREEGEARLAAARAALEAARENARVAAAADDYAQARFRRTSELFLKGIVARDAMEQDEAEARKTLAQRKSAEHAAEAARSEAEAARASVRSWASVRRDGAAENAVTVRSPVAGRVLAVRRQSEGTVAAGETLLEVGDPAGIELAVDVLSSDAVKIRPGMAVVVERWGGDVALEGRVRTVEPVGFTKVSALGVEEQRVLVIGDITSPRSLWKNLGDGYRLEARFVLWEGKDVLQVPESALVRRAGEWAVFVVEKGRAKSRTVEVGKRGGAAAQVVGGLAEGETVVLHPGDKIGDGVRLGPR